MAISSVITSAPSSLIGGNITGILLRQGLLRATSGIRRALFETKNPEVFLFGAIPVNVRTQENYVFSAEMTKYAVEDGSVFSDHIIVDPVTISVSFELLKYAKDLTRINYSFDLLQQAFDNRAPIDLVLTHKKLTNMVFTRLEATNQAPRWGSLVCRASFSQLNKVVLSTVPFSQEKVKYPVNPPTGSTIPGGPDMSKSAQGKISEGIKTPKIPASLALGTLFKAFR